jgi:hypothetical protein
MFTLSVPHMLPNMIHGCLALDKGKHLAFHALSIARIPDVHADSPSHVKIATMSSAYHR